jgi:hypothetical protein
MKNEFKTKWNDKEVTLYVSDITPKIRRDSEKYVNKAFQQAIEDGALLTAEVNKLLEARLSLEEDKEKLDVLRETLKTKESVLLSGKDNGKRLSKLEGRAVALEILKLRNQIDLLNSNRDSLYNRTAESLSESERINYLIFATIYNLETNRTFFKSYEDYLDNSDTELVADSKNYFFKFQFNHDVRENENSEIKFLRKYNFIDQLGRLIDSKGRLCDENFRLVDEKGRYINENGEFINIYGHKVDENGNLIIDVDPEAYKD